MDGTGRSTLRRALAGAVVVLAFVGLVFVVARGIGDESGSSPSPKPTDDLAPVRQPRTRAEQPPAPTEPPPKSVRVTVTSMDRKPIPGARVELVRGPDVENRHGLPRQHFPSIEAPSIARASVSDEAGVATVGEVPPGRWYVVGAAPGFARHVLVGTTREEDVGVDAQVALEKGSPFVGKILDPDGALASGVVVVLEPITVWSGDAACLRTTTDEDGAYRFDCVPPGEHWLWYAPHREFLIPAACVLVPSLDGLDVRMVRGAAIEGAIRDADTGAPVNGARVLGFRYEESGRGGVEGPTTLLDVAVSDRDGRFALRTWRKQSELSYLLVDAPGYAPTPIEVEGLPLPGAVADGQRFVVDLRIRRAAVLKGTLSGPDGPLSGFRVEVTPKDEGSMYETRPPAPACWTDAGGRFRIERLPAGAAVVAVHDALSSWSIAPKCEVDLVAGRETVRDIRLQVERVRVTRLVDDSDFKPVEGAEIVQRFGSLLAQARTDAEGRFTLDAVFTGDWAFVELRKGRIRQTARLDRGDYDGSTLFPSLPAASEVLGKLDREDGTPVGGRRVYLVAGDELAHGFDSRWSGLRETVSAADGTYRMALTGGPEFYVRTSGALELDRTQDDDRSTIFRAPALVHVEGRSVFAGGDEAVAGALVKDKHGDVVGRADADGKFEFDWAPLLDEPVRLVRDEWSSAPFESVAAPKVVEMRRSIVVAGVVRLADGSPARGLRVVVRPRGRATEGRTPWNSTSATDADGRFIVPGLDAGVVEVTVTDPDRHALFGPRMTTTTGGGELALVARAAARLVVEVVLDDGKPASEADVTALPDLADLAGDAAGTDDAGRATLGLAPDAAHTLRVDRHGFATVERADVRAGGEPLRVVLERKR